MTTVGPLVSMVNVSGLPASNRRVLVALASIVNVPSVGWFGLGNWRMNAPGDRRRWSW